jgi:nucleoside-diphosphate-sugar epimerase
MVVSLLRDGHTVKLLVRRPEQVPETFDPHGVSFAPDDVVTGDVLDEASVRAALPGCDAVVHAAAIFSFDPRKAQAMLATNARATQIVLSAALDNGCDPVVHVSSSVALIRHGGSGPDLPLGDIESPYSRSKVLSEQVARELQEQGRPVVTVYPGGIYGPYDPYVGPQTDRFFWLVRGLFPLWSAGGSLSTDARDAAEVVARVMEPGRGPRRYVVPGIHMRSQDLYGAIEQAIGRRRPHLELPARFALATAQVVEAVQSRLPERFRYPADLEGAELSLRDTHLDDGPARRDLGITPIPFAQTIRDEIAWAVDAGHLPEKYRPV